MMTILKNRHFVNLEILSTTEINSLIERSLAFKRGEPAPDYSDKTLVNLFFENSTRTRSSFEMAEHRLNMHLLPFETATSSVQKEKRYAIHARHSKQSAQMLWSFATEQPDITKN